MGSFAIEQWTAIQLHSVDVRCMQRLYPQFQVQEQRNDAATL